MGDLAADEVGETDERLADECPEEEDVERELRPLLRSARFTGSAIPAT